MDLFNYRNGELYCESVAVAAIAEAVGTPTYVYSAATLANHYLRLATAFAELKPIICYSIKSCGNLEIIRLLTMAGAGMDVVSGGELYRAVKAGADTSKIVFAGVGKTDAEINQAIDANIGWFNIESEAELANLIEIAERRDAGRGMWGAGSGMNIDAGTRRRGERDAVTREDSREEIPATDGCGKGFPHQQSHQQEGEPGRPRPGGPAAGGGRGAAVRAALRVNPDVDPQTHRHTSTGKRESKFGVDLERARSVFAEFGRQDAVQLSGIHLHIGSPVMAIEAYEQAIVKTLGLIADLRRDGFTIDTLDIGGGFRADYEGPGSPSYADYAARLVPLLRGQGLQIILEPGRTISANAGILLARTLYVKHSGDKEFVIVDGSMTELIRPALYDAYHFVWPAQPGVGFVPDPRGKAANFPGTRMVDVVGPVCESADFLAKERLLPPIKRGDLMAVFTAGAYGFVMASHYNARPNAAEVLVEGDQFRVIRKRETYEDLVRAEELNV